VTIKIEIEAHPDRGDMGVQIEQAMSALGYYQVSHKGRVILDTHVEDNTSPLTPYGEALAAAATNNSADAPLTSGLAQQAAPARKRGEPSPGKARRTKAEIAEDEAAAAANIAAVDPVGDALTAAGFTASELAISTGGNRIGPDDTPEDAAQDAADEKAEQDAKREPGKLTHQDLQAAVGAYQKKHGWPAAIELFKEGGLIGRPMIEVPEAELEAAIAKINGAATPEVSKPVEQASDKPAAAAEKPVTRDDLIGLMKDYVARYGAEAAEQDGPRIFESALGKIPDGLVTSAGKPATKWVLSVVPTDGESLAKAVKWWKSALTQAPEAFGRKAVS